MPFLAKEKVILPEKDIISWYYDEPQYDHDQPIYLDALDASKYYTANTAKTAIRQLVAGFQDAGLAPGDCVGLHSFNNLHYPVIANGIVAFGGIFAGTNPAYTKYELVHHIKTSRAKSLIVEPDLLQGALEAAKETGIPLSRIYIFDNQPGDKIPSGFQSWRSLLSHGEKDWVRLSGEAAKTTTVARLFSSGTTGLPKAAVLSHYNLIAQNDLTNARHARDYSPVRRLMALPMFHAAAVPSTHYGALRCGYQVFIMRRFELDSFLKYIELHQITDLTVVPPMALAIIMSEASKKYNLKSIRFGNTGAAPLDKGPQARLEGLLAPGAKVTQVWGMTETSCICTQFKYDEPDTTGAVGYPLPGMDIKLVDDDGKDITDYDVRGEICVRGPLVVSGYFENPEANKRDWDEDRYFHTGDIGYCARDSKKWYIVDRKKVKDFASSMLNHSHLAGTHQSPWLSGRAT
jgi:4-coumarate--CoA ligase